MIQIAILYRNKKYYDIDFNTINKKIYVNNKKAKYFLNKSNIPCLKAGKTIIEDISIIVSKLITLHVIAA